MYPHPQVTSVLVDASTVAQIEQNVDALKNLAFTEEELTEINRYAQEGNINLWAASSKIR